MMLEARRAVLTPSGLIMPISAIPFVPPVPTVKRMGSLQTVRELTEGLHLM